MRRLVLAPADGERAEDVIGGVAVDAVKHEIDRVEARPGMAALALVIFGDCGVDNSKEAQGFSGFCRAASPVVLEGNAPAGIRTRNILEPSQ